MTTFKLHQKIRFRNYYSPGSKYKRFEGQTGRITYVNNGNSYDIMIESGTYSKHSINYVSGKMIETYESGLSAEQKHQNIVARFNKTISEAKNVIGEKQAVIENSYWKLEYLEENPEITEFNETNFLAWKTSQTIVDHLIASFSPRIISSHVIEESNLRDDITGIVISTLEEINKLNK
jgi:hypothetical protein